MFLKVEGLSKVQGKKMLFNQLSFNLEKGDILGIVGPSGVGKSTLLRILAGLETKNKGEIYLEEKQVNPEENPFLGFVFQDFQLFPHLTVAENILVGPRFGLKKSATESLEKLTQLAENLQITSLLERYPHELSGGQKQRVAIARTMIMERKIIAYDEPTSALDEGLTAEVGKLFLRLQQQGITQIVVTHDLAFARKYCQKLFYLNENKLEVLS